MSIGSALLGILFFCAVKLVAKGIGIVAAQISAHCLQEGIIEFNPARSES